MSRVEISYVSQVWQTRQPLINNIQSQLPENAVLAIIFKHYNTFFPADDDRDIEVIRPPRVLTAQNIITDVPRAKLLSDKKASNALMSEVLSRMDVPIWERANIVKKIFRELESANVMQPIRVVIIRIIPWDLSQMIQRVTNESMNTYEVRPKPASKSFLKDVERVSLDDFEDAKESCVICMECFEGGVKAIRLPYSHIFHEECGEKWLAISHLCPLCRYPMPSEED